MHTLATVGLLSRYEREPPRRLFPSGSSPPSFSISAQGAFEKSLKRLRSQGSLLHHLPFNICESTKPLEVCSHTARKKKENFRKRKGSKYNALGSYPLDEPWKNNGKNRRLLRISINDNYRES